MSYYIQVIFFCFLLFAAILLYYIYFMYTLHKKKL
jgi:hypothetical protein